jgi:hypothetical protein
MRKAAGLAVMLALASLPYRAHATPTSGGEIVVQGLSDALLSTMKNGRTLGQSGRFAQLEPVIRRSFDIPSMTRLSVGLSWAGLTCWRTGSVTNKNLRSDLPPVRPTRAI